MKILLSLMLFMPLVLILGRCGSVQEKQVGLHNGQFQACPDTPNCVSSMEPDSPCYISPIAYTAISFDEASDRLRTILMRTERCRIITSESRYIHAEFRSKVFRFVDDTEFFFPEDQSIIHVRSASRIGSSDLGVNRKRIENIRILFHQRF